LDCFYLLISTESLSLLLGDFIRNTQLEGHLDRCSMVNQEICDDINISTGRKVCEMAPLLR